MIVRVKKLYCSFYSQYHNNKERQGLNSIMASALVQGKSYTEKDYYHLPENVRAELIDGQFYDMAAPSRVHQEISAELLTTIRQYFKAKNGSCRAYAAPFAVKLSETMTTIVEPDISVICDSNKLTDRGCSGAPDWIIEITSPGNPGHDYILKLNLYAEAGVREYWIVDPTEQTIFVYHLEKEQFRAVAYTFQSKIKVNIYDDLYINFSDIAELLPK